MKSICCAGKGAGCWGRNRSIRDDFTAAAQFDTGDTEFVNETGRDRV